MYGLDFFPKLNAISFFGSKIDLSTNKKWLNNIEIFFAEKTSFTGLDSFSKMSNLTALHLAYSSFDTFPKHFEKLSCLNELTLGAYSYSYGKIDLTQIDMSNHKCLNKIHIVSWSNTFKGIPKGLKKSNIKDLKITHPQLTELDKIELKKVSLD